MIIPPRRFPWVTVSAVVSAFVVATVTWVQIPGSSISNSSNEAGALPSLGLASSGLATHVDIMAEQLAAYDPTPLFIPTEMSSSAEFPRDTEPGQGAPFPTLPVELTKTSPLRFPLVVVPPDSVVSGLQLTERVDAPLMIARRDETAKPLAERDGYLEAITMQDGGRVVLALSLPKSAGLPAGDWQPLELVGAVTRMGLTGELVVTSSSGSDEIDAYFRSYLAKSVRLGERLPAGLYAFRVGP